MEDYNRLISDMLLNNVDSMINKVPQPTMFGGKRVRDFVLPGSTDYSYPGTLAVGSLSRQQEPSTLGGTFWKDFGEKEFLNKEMLEEHPDAYSLEGGKGGIGRELGMTLAKEVIKEGVKQGAKYATSGGRRRGGPRPAVIAPHPGQPRRRREERDLEAIAHDIYRDNVVPEGKELLKMYIRSMVSGEPMQYEGGKKLNYKPRPDFINGHPVIHLQHPAEKQRAMIWKKWPKYDINKVNKPSADLRRRYGEPRPEVEEEEIIIPKKKAKAKKAKAKPNVIIEEEEEEIIIPKKKRKGKAKAQPKIRPLAELNEESEEEESEGGALIRNYPSEFHTSVYPPALASYSATVPYGHDAYGRGRGKAKAKRKPSERGKIVKEVMAKMHLSLPEASKYVKENGLY